MDKKHMIWLAAALVVLAAVYGALSLSNKRVEEKEKAEEEAQVIQVADLGEIVSFSYSAPEQETLHFEKKESDWICTDDKKMELEQTYPNGIADAFTDLTATRRMEEIDALEDYGLKEPSYTVSLQPKEGKETVFLIGDSTGDEYYLRVKGEEGVVYTVSSAPVGTLDHSLEDMEKTEDEEETDP